MRLSFARSLPVEWLIPLIKPVIRLRWFVSVFISQRNHNHNNHINQNSKSLNAITSLCPNSHFDRWIYRFGKNFERWPYTQPIIIGLFTFVCLFVFLFSKRLSTMFVSFVEIRKFKRNGFRFGHCHIIIRHESLVSVRFLLWIVFRWFFVE